MKKVILYTIVALIMTSQVIFASPDIEDAGIFKVTEQSWIYYVNEPLKHFRLAYQYLEQEDYESCAYELRQAIAYLVLESLREIPDKEDLTQAVNQLDELAHSLEEGKIISQEEYNIIFTDVNYTLSKHYRIQAMRSWENERPRRTGYALQASVQHLERAAKLSDYEFDPNEKATLKDSRELFKELINNPKQTDEKVVKPQIRALGGVLKDFNVKSDEELKVKRNF